MNIKIILGIITGIFSKGHERTLRAKRNIAVSFIIKGFSILISLILVPLTINYLNPTKYGIWITLSSIISWFVFFDIGLGHGLRNRFAEALATNKKELARIYVSTTYAILSLIIAGVLVLFFIINPFLNWGIILNAGDDVMIQKELSILALVIFTFFCFHFVFKLITTILIADQRPAKAAFFDFLGKIISLVIIFILTKTTEGSLLYLGIVMTSTPVIVLLLSSVWYYNRKYNIYRPSLKFVDFSKAKDLLNLGVKFFIIQIAAILLFQTNNIIISHLFGPAEVTPYNVAFRYFNILIMGFSIILIPFWSAFTEAWFKKEIEWIKNSMRKLIQIWGLLFVVGFIMLIFSPSIYKIWVGDKVTIPFKISALVGAWILLNAWNGIYSNFLNGVGKIKLQLYIGIIAALLNVPLALFLGDLIGLKGVLIANLLLGINTAWIFPLQYQKIIKGKTKGIWYK